VRVYRDQIRPSPLPAGIIDDPQSGRRTFRLFIPPRARSGERSQHAPPGRDDSGYIAAIIAPARHTPSPGIASFSTCGIGPDW